MFRLKKRPIVLPLLFDELSEAIPTMSWTTGLRIQRMFSWALPSGELGDSPVSSIGYTDIPTRMRMTIPHRLTVTSIGKTWR